MRRVMGGQAKIGGIPNQKPNPPAQDRIMVTELFT